MFNDYVTKFSKALDYCARALVVLLMLLIDINVILSLIGLPIYGTYEIATFLTAGIIAFALAYCGLLGGHVAVDFIVDKFPIIPRKIICVIDSTCCVLICAIIGRQCWVFADAMRIKGEVTSALYMPISPIVYVLSVSFIILSLTYVVELIHNIHLKKEDASIIEGGEKQ